MLHRISLITKRDYIAAVRTKAFLFGLVFAPLMFGGAFIVIALMRGNVDADRHLAIFDRTGVAAPAVIRAIEEQNRKDMFDAITGRKTMPRYVLEAVGLRGGDPEATRLELSDRLRSRELFAFLEIGGDALNPAGEKDPEARISLYTSAGGLDQFQGWIAQPVNQALRRVRLEQAGITANRLESVLSAIPVVSMVPITRDKTTGAIAPPRKKDAAASFGVPYALMIMMIMIVMLGSVTMLPAVAEDKLQRVFEMLLVSASPFELMMGKALAGLARSLTGAVFYIAGAYLALQALALAGLAPLELLPWFFLYVVAEVMMISSLAIALGAACGSPQDAQSLNQVLMIPIIAPFFFFAPILQDPNGLMANVVSLIPPLTPALMLFRQALPGGVPAWEPWVGLAGALLCSTAVVWGASRIFRVAILFQGAAPKLPELFRWAVRG